MDHETKKINRVLKTKRLKVFIVVVEMKLTSHGKEILRSKGKNHEKWNVSTHINLFLGFFIDLPFIVFDESERIFKTVLFIPPCKKKVHCS